MKTKKKIQGFSYTSNTHNSLLNHNSSSNSPYTPMISSYFAYISCIFLFLNITVTFNTKSMKQNRSCLSGQDVLRLFKGPEGLLQGLQETITGPDPEPDLLNILFPF